MEEILLSNGYTVCKYGTELTVAKDCFCEHYIHEITNYPREGLKEKKLLVDEKVVFINHWKNFYGSYIRCKYKDTSDSEYFDISPENLKYVNT